MADLHFFGIHIFYYLIVVAFLLPKVPVVGKFFNIINTLIHELGHALMALVFEGKVVRIEIFKDTGGVTVTKSKSGVAAFFVSIAGYPFAAAAGLLCAYLLSIGYGSWIVLGLSILFLFMLILWVRNGYGVLWVILFCLLNCIVVFYLKKPLYIEIAAWFYTLMIIIESVWSSLVLLYLSIFHADPRSRLCLGAAVRRLFPMDGVLFGRCGERVDNTIAGMAIVTEKILLFFSRHFFCR